MDSIITEEQLQVTFPYLDNITICGKDLREHDVNLKHFLEAASQWQIKYNDSKCVFSTRKFAILGSIIEEGDIRPDSEHLRPLQVLPVPEDRKVSIEFLGFFPISPNRTTVILRRSDPSQLSLASRYLWRLKLLSKH